MLQLNYMNADTGEVTLSHREAVDWYRAGVRVLLYTWNGNGWKFRLSWDQ